MKKLFPDCPITVSATSGGIFFDNFTDGTAQVKCAGKNVSGENAFVGVDLPPGQKVFIPNFPTQDVRMELVQ